MAPKEAVGIAVVEKKIAETAIVPSGPKNVHTG
jgi:hypothetical protein